MIESETCATVNVQHINFLIRDIIVLTQGSGLPEW